MQPSCALCWGGLGYSLHSGTPLRAGARARRAHLKLSLLRTPFPSLPPLLPFPPLPPSFSLPPASPPPLQKSAEDLGVHLHETYSKSIAEFYPGQMWDGEYSGKLVAYLFSEEVAAGKSLDAVSQGRIEEKYARIAKREVSMPTEADMQGVEQWETVDKDKKSKPQPPPPSSRDTRAPRPAV